MSDQKLTDLTSITELDGTELIYVVQDGADKKATLNDISDLIPKGDKGDKGDTGDPGPNIVTTTTSTNISGILKGTGTNVAQASAGTDYASASHTHTIANVTGLQTALDGKQPLATVLTNTTAAFTTAQETKLSGIATGATANSSDATLLARANHTGTQAISTVSGLQTALDGKQATLVSGTNIKTINGASVLGSGDLTVTGTGAEPVHFLQQAANYTLANSGSTQKLFDQTANGALTLPTGKYQFECFLYLTGMSGTTGNGAFHLLGAGTATLDDIMYQVVGVDSTTPLGAAARGGSASITQNSVNPMVTSAAGTGLIAQISGVFDVTVTGTIIPSIALNTAIAAVVQANSYFKCQKIANTGVMASSGWS